ncbi:MAG: hypothetical protein ACI4V3_09185, partial [Faecousia sp.]
CHCEERSDAAILCRHYGMRTNLQSEIATTSVRTGLAMTNGSVVSCPCPTEFFEINCGAARAA